MPRADSAFRLKLVRADFENHVVKPMNTDGGEGAGHFISVNGKVNVFYLVYVCVCVCVRVCVCVCVRVRVRVCVCVCV